MLRRSDIYAMQVASLLHGPDVSMDRITAARVFVETAERGSATAAAEALGMSRAMASRYLAELEKWTGTRVLHRTTRSLGLTSAGERVLASAREIIRLADDLETIASEGSSPHGRLRITAPPVLVEARLTELIAEFVKRHPRIKVDLRASDRTIDLVEDRIDLAIRIAGELPLGAVARKLGDVRSVLCAAPTYLQDRGTPSSVEDLRDHQCLIYANFGSTEWILKSHDQTVPVTVSGPLQADEVLALRRAAISGMGIAMLPLFAVSQYLKAGELVRVLPEWEPQPLPIHALYLSRSYLPASVRAFIDFVSSGKLGD